MIFDKGRSCEAKVAILGLCRLLLTRRANAASAAEQISFKIRDGNDMSGNEGLAVRYELNGDAKLYEMVIWVRRRRR
jgi:hypothetical protein